MSKEIDILTVLYPAGIVAKDICEVYETVMPKIRQLIDGVDIGYTRAEALCGRVAVAVPNEPPASETEVLTEPTAPVADVFTKWSERKREECEPPHTEEDTVETVCDEPPDGKYTFVESVRHEESGWHEEKYKNSRYFRKGDDIVIRTGNSRIDTTWRYLCEFFGDLSDETKLGAIAGINRPKTTALIEFYEAHPNFACEMVKDGTAKIFKKVDVRVGMATHGEGEPIAASDYEISAY